MTRTGYLSLLGLLAWLGGVARVAADDSDRLPDNGSGDRTRVELKDGWRFFKYPDGGETDPLIYDVRPAPDDARDDRPADEPPTEAVAVTSDREVLKPWILPSANEFLAVPADHHVRPEGDPGGDFPFVRADFDDSSWQRVDLPHDWAIAGPFLEGPDAAVGGGMGRLPSPGVGWYRRTLEIPAEDEGKRFRLEVDGAMAYAMVWLNGQLVGGWPYGYNSWQLDLTPYMVPGEVNQLAIRLDNPPDSSRWYPGGGLYRNVWLTTTAAVRVAQWGTRVTTPRVDEQRATVELGVSVVNGAAEAVEVVVESTLHSLDDQGERRAESLASWEPETLRIAAGEVAEFRGSVEVVEPRRWGPPPEQHPHLHVAVTVVRVGGRIVDRQETVFGIRSLEFDGERGLLVNGERIFVRGVNLHHDLGALGAAFHRRAAERQLEKLRAMGCNAVRMAHNPPAPEFLDLTDRMGFLVVDEVFDCWERKKTPLDFHLIFPEWHEADLRSMIRRDRNHPSVILWSVGNEVGEQYTGEDGAEIARRLRAIAEDEDPSRPSTASMNYAKPDMPFAEVFEVINLNYQGEGIRDAPAYRGLEGITTPPLYRRFHDAFPERVILSSENAAAVSSRGEYRFPVFDGLSAPVQDGQGGDPMSQQVSGYELYTMPFGSSADKVFGALERHPFVGGGFVWAGWDYLGEPSPYYGARSSYYGIFDLAGFPKDRYFLYRSHWLPDEPTAHILPHWNWTDRIGEVTPVHVFTSGDDAELFLNGRSLGRRSKGEGEYRLRWDEVVYEPGTLEVRCERKGRTWASDRVVTTGEAERIELEVDRDRIAADGDDLAFVTARLVDAAGNTVPDAGHRVRFRVAGAGELVATDNGDPTCMIAFPAAERPAFHGRCLAIVRSLAGKPGAIRVEAVSDGLGSVLVELEAISEP